MIKATLLQKSLPLVFFFFFSEAKGRGYLGKVALLSNGDGAGVWPRFISKEITAIRWHLAGNSGRDDLNEVLC